MWYSSGTVAATNNSNVITGTGTAFIANVRIGDGITIQGSQSLHEVIGIASNTQLTIRPAYTGTSGSGKQFACAPILGYDKDLSDAFNQLRLQFGDKLSALQPWAHAATASAAMDALGFSSVGKTVATGSAAQGRGALGLGTAATANVTTSNTDTTAGRVMKVGDFGFGVGQFNYYMAGYPTAIQENFTQIYRRNESDNGVGAYAASIHLAANDTWGRLRIGPDRNAWIQGGNMYVGWTAQLHHTGNILQSTGQSTQFPMSQKAVTDAINGVSDLRDKSNVIDLECGLDLVKQLNPVQYSLNQREWYRKKASEKEVAHELEDGKTETTIEHDKDVLAQPLTDFDDNDGSLARSGKYTGFIAQELKQTLIDNGLSDLELVKSYKDEYGGEDKLYIEHTGLIAILTKAIQEQQVMIESLTMRLESLEGDK